MGILASDLAVKSAIEAALADLRSNSWILEDIFAGLANDPLTSKDSGYAEVYAAKSWFMETSIPVYFNNRVDTPKMPCITVVRTSSREALDRTSLADDQIYTEEIEPQSINRQIINVIDQFTPKAYNKSVGEVTLPNGITTFAVSPGQFLVSKKSSKAYVIEKVIDDVTFKIADNTNDDFTNCYIVPALSLWNLEQGVTYLHETFSIGLHAQSDTQQVLWLRQIIQYIFLRYKEAYLERRGLELSTFSVGSVDVNPSFDGIELIFTCMAQLECVVEATFIRYAAPKLGKVTGGVKIIDGPKTPEAYQSLAQKQGWSMEED